MSLVRALHGRAAMAGAGAPWLVMGELAGEGREGEWEVERWVQLGGVTLLLCVVSVRFGTVLREEESRKEEGEEKREKRKEEGKEKKKRKKEKKSKLGNFQKK
jgi:hypothetical protein